MISSCFVTAIQVLILFTLSSPFVLASTFTGSMFEVQISTKLPVKDWVKEAKKDSDPFSLWDPTCFKFVSAIKSVDNQLKEALYTCHSVPGGDENTRLKIYLVIPPEELTPEKQEPCLRAAYKKTFDDWKAGVSANFQIRPEQVQFSSIFKRFTAEEEGLKKEGLKSWINSLFPQCKTDIPKAEVEVKTMTGLAFEIELEIEQNHWEFQVTTDENHYSAWSPTCRKFIEATAMVNEVIRNNLIGCRSNETGTKTQMTIYMALSPTDLTAESFTPCKTNYFTQWKIAISKNFKIHTDNVHFLPITRSVNLQAMRILANVEKATGLVTSSDLLSEEDKVDMKVFLTRWMQFMDEWDKLIGFRISFHGDAAAAVDVGLLFDVTNQTELNMIKTMEELSDKAKRYPGPVKLTECELTIPKFPEATYKKFTNCDNEAPSVKPTEEENGSKTLTCSLTTPGP